MTEGVAEAFERVAGRLGRDLGVDLHRHGETGVPGSCMATLGWTSRSARSVAQVRRASWTVIGVTLALPHLVCQERWKLRGSMGVPWRMVKTSLPWAQHWQVRATWLIQICTSRDWSRSSRLAPRPGAM